MAYADSRNRQGGVRGHDKIHAFPALDGQPDVETASCADRLRQMAHSIRRLKSSGKIGFFQEPGGNCLYSEEELGRYLEDNRVEADGSL